jgi:hypothetical protein
MHRASCTELDRVAARGASLSDYAAQNDRRNKSVERGNVTNKLSVRWIGTVCFAESRRKNGSDFAQRVGQGRL